MGVRPQTRSVSVPPPARVSKDLPVLLQDPVIKAIADKHGRTPAQVALRFQLQRGLVVLAKSFNEQRMRENLQVRGGRPLCAWGRSLSPRGLCARKPSRPLTRPPPPPAAGRARSALGGSVSRPLIPSAAR